MHFMLIFKNGTIWKSPNIFRKNPGWANEENGTLGGIREMRIPITKEKIIVLKGFEKYNFFVEATQNLNGRGRARIEAFCFCGSKKGKVLAYRINPINQEIVRYQCPEGAEYAGSATRGWREGLFGEQAKEGICSL